MPEACQDLIREAAEALSCPPDYIAVPMLAVLAADIGNSRAIKIKGGYETAAQIYAAVVAEPGAGKSPALSVAMRPAFKAQMEAKEDYRIDKKIYEEKVEEWRKAKKDKNTIEGPEPLKPKLHSVFVEDTTVEALGEILADNPRGVVLYRDELEAWVQAMNQYKAKGQGADAQFYKSAWSGALARIDRKTADEPLIIPNPFLCVVGGVQPDVLKSFGADKDDGFWDRILFSFPDPVPTLFTYDDISLKASASYASLYRNLSRLKMETSPDAPKRAVTIPLHEEAKELFKDEINSLSAEKDAPGFPRRLKGVWAKLTTYLPRFALVLAMCRAHAPEELEFVDDELTMVDDDGFPTSTGESPDSERENGDAVDEGDVVDDGAGTHVSHGSKGGMTEGREDMILQVDVTNATKIIEYFKGMARTSWRECLREDLGLPRSYLSMSRA